MRFGNMNDQTPVRVENPDGISQLEGGKIRHNLYDTMKAPLIGSGDWEVRHDHIQKSDQPVGRIPNGR